MPPAVNFDLAHVLFMDVIGFSKLLIDDQHEMMDELNEIVRATDQFRAAEEKGKLISLPTGDGMALAFLERSDAPVRCAVEVARALKSHPQIQLRMGIHSGAVRGVTDVNQRANVAGAGMNLAQRVMDCGDAGHILLSQRVAEDLAQFREWAPSVRELGECEVKHGDRIRLFNLVGDDFGNREVPGKLVGVASVPVPRKKVPSRQIFMAAAAVSFLAALSVGVWLASHRTSGRATAVASQTATDVPEKSIAVLPLENLSEEKENAFFADGIQDDILTSLAKISDLKVISRTSVMQYRSATRSLADIGRALGVANILEGSVRRVGKRVLVNVQLIDAIHDRHLWAERYDRTLEDSIGLQGELAAEIANVLRAKLAPEEKVRLAAKPTKNPEAYVLYLQAKERERVASSKQDALAIDGLYTEAITRDPEFALAYVRASGFNSLMYQVGGEPMRKERARTLLDQAIRLAPSLGETHLAQGYYYYRADRNYDAALKEFAIAVAASPNDPEILELSGLIFRRQGKWRDALAAFDKAQELDPRHAHLNGQTTRALLRDWTGAVAAARHAVETEPDSAEPWGALAASEVDRTGDPAVGRAMLDKLPENLRRNPDIIGKRWQLAMLARDFAWADQFAPDPPEDEFRVRQSKAYYLGRTALARGDVAGAKAILEPLVERHEKLVQGSPDLGGARHVLAMVYCGVGRKADAIREQEESLKGNEKRGDAIEIGAAAGDLALVYALTGEKDKAIALIEKLITTPAADTITITALRLGWEWDSLRKDPRFQKLVTGPEPKTVY